MSLLRNVIMVVLVVSALSACGFRPVYEDYGVVKSGADKDLAAIDIGAIAATDKRVEQMLRTNLEKELDPLSIGAQKRYKLDITLTTGIESLGVKKSAEVTRYKLFYDAVYTMVDVDSKKSIKTGKSRIVGGYDAVASDFGTYAAQKDTEIRVIQEVAKDIKLRLTSFFLNGE